MYKLLLVDDEPLIRQGITKLIDFKELSISEVFEASDGEEALLLVTDKNPDIVLADINMPLKDGLALAKEIKLFRSDIRIVIITGYDYFDYAVSAIKVGVNDFVLKPVSKNDIMEILKKQVRELNEQNAQEHVLKSWNEIQKISENEDSGDYQYKELIVKLMQEHIADTGFSLTALAHKINLTPGYLSNLFKKMFGIPFQDYLIKTRLERSKILLLSSKLKVYEVALKVGFDDPNYFSTSFKKYFGVSPNKFKEESLGETK